MRNVNLFRSALLLACLVALPLFAQAPGNPVLTNADVAKMVKGGLPESIIVREIQMSRTSFSATPGALIELKRQGASEAVLGAVLDSQMGAGNPRSEMAPAPYMAIPSASPHHLPSFEAELRVNPTKKEKVSVGHNQIKVVQSGVPVFSLKWKEPKDTTSSK